MAIGSVVDVIRKMRNDMAAADAALPVDRVIRQIANRHRSLDQFWSKAKGWAPDSAAEMLANVRLDRLTALAWSLRRWTSIPQPLDDGDLILAWANLGALVEGALKLLLCVYLEDFKADGKNGQGTGAFHIKKQMMLDPDGLRLDVVIAYYEKRALLSKQHLELARLVQGYRNAIHALKDVEIGTRDELIASIRAYRDLLRDVSGRLPYPDDVFEPVEHGPYDDK